MNKTSNRVTHSEAPSGTKKNILLGSIILVWLSATLLGLWWFQQQTIRPFINTDDDPRMWQAAQVEPLFQAALEQLPQNSADVVLFHFWNPDCLCNQVSQRHFDGILQQFDASELSVVVITSTRTRAEQIAEFRRLNGERMSLLQLSPETLPLSASPGLALFNKVENQYEMGYFGAYGFGALCTVANDDFFPNIIRNLQQGPYGPFMNVAGDGCFCAWNPAAH
ncbi:DUF6436 domain-containing protein [Bacterioplanoides sp.]|uniref:DUF6436 domain-containing protein n=1 Tax=Bacterioplanoides sp. TaxID=2066072 RepID=UPI003AFF6637